MEQPPRNRLAELANPPVAPSPIDHLFGLASGNELVMVECMLYLHDLKLIDKGVLANRMRDAAARYDAVVAADNYIMKTSLHPLRRVADALDAAKTLTSSANE